MLAYDIDFPAPIGAFPSGGYYMTFQDGLIIRYEFFLMPDLLRRKRKKFFLNLNLCLDHKYN